MIVFKVELFHRVFVRQYEDLRGRFKFVEEQLTFEDIPIVVEMRDTYWRISPEDVTKCRDGGFLVVDYMDDLCLIVREQKIILVVGSYDEGRQIMSEAQEICGNCFVITRVIEEEIREFQAL